MTPARMIGGRSWRAVRMVSSNSYVTCKRLVLHGASWETEEGSRIVWLSV